jgi:ATP-binding cassette subfamily B (MDR/TAP) protein 1
MVKNKSIQIPFMTFCKLSKDMGIQNDVDLEVMWVIPFRNVIGSFMCAILCTRHDIAQAMGVVNQFMVNHV